MIRHTLVSLAIGAVISFTSLAQSTNGSLDGQWYGIYQGGPVTVSFSEGKVFSLDSEASSSMMLSAEYTVNESTSPSRISFGGAIPGMAGEGIFKVDGSTLEMLCIFGAPGQVAVPSSFDEGNMNPAAMHLFLSRDKSILESVKKKAEVPTEAALAFERNRRLGNGVNLNSTFDGLSGDRPVDDGMLEKIAKAGFESVRIPIRWSDHCSKEAPYKIDPSFYSRVDKVMDKCLSLGLAVSLDLHYYPVISFAGTPDLPFDENIERFYSIWEQLSSHYKGYGNDLYFDLMNEPGLSLDPGLWNEMVSKALKIIRKENPDRTVIVMTPSLGQHWTIGLLDFPEDDWNIIAEAHYYLPHLFTHQGLAYAMAEQGLGMKWTATAEERAAIEHDFKYLSGWSERTGRPVNIGEYGVCSLADEDSRAEWLRYMRATISRYGMSSHIWALYRDTFQIYDEKTGSWNGKLLDAAMLR
ncbi:MAG: glycoside hydrolase family 5 protein [Bacteroidales bacterium]|nr:glycoside hydrolase family 5 protein [Bacteroidales bacterium]